MPVVRHRRGALALALAPGLAFQAWILVQSGDWSASGVQFSLADDAMISLTYGRTLAQTGQLVWYPGAPRVQGYTNLLWTLYLALLHVVGLAGSMAALAVMLTNVALLMGTALLSFRVVARLVDDQDSHLTALVAAGTVALAGPLDFWSIRGMETGLIAFLLLVAVSASQVLLTRWAAGGGTESRTGSLCLALGGAAAVGVLTRLDVAVLMAVPLALLTFWAQSGHRRVQVLLLGVLPAAVGVLAVLAFQYVYYSDWLPNTYDLKLKGFSLADRVARGLVAEGKVLPVLCLAGWGFVAIRRWAPAHVRRIATLLLGLTLAAAAYSVWVGGDAWELYLFCNRYQAVVLPLTAILAVVGVRYLCAGPSVGGGARRVVAATTALSGLGMGLLPNPTQFLWPFATACVVTVLGVIAILDRSARAQMTITELPRALALTAGLFVVVSSVTLVLVVGVVGLNGDERKDSVLGRLVDRGTAPDARIAVTTAGASAYYARRPMIDLLGKSDRVIATGPPAQIDPNDPNLQPFRTLYPGHNKWNYAYSIGELRPDVVLFLFHTDDLAQMTAWGYGRRCLDGSPVFVRLDSVKWDRTVFQECPT